MDTWNGGDKFEIIGMRKDKRIINIAYCSYSYREWDLIGIFYYHAILFKLFMKGCKEKNRHILLKSHFLRYL